MKREWKVGDLVILDPNKCSRRNLMHYSPSGRVGEEYVIASVLADGYVRFVDGNYYKQKWLSLKVKIYLGGE